ncbi:hypothetical protein SAMN04487905_101319 [Actinopolyspora xinjiangensis]|uniref:Uncharacterized protein n=1 Tax=Actinopolyspora xinjiangensis TaxID=405564 RepID=A0A1H0NZ30_9ACTN|nr:hypothetical protein SAMN04487905_101319 [Actinopolyspora xinjiangensis]
MWRARRTPIVPTGRSGSDRSARRSEEESADVEAVVPGSGSTGQLGSDRVTVTPSWLRTAGRSAKASETRTA